ncbi:HNH endonuclease family protein [Marinobacter bryozoorum]|uniref:HNH endonuclease family protein n=1 Tax=Marinobacter bryozoorum TaxID=256324 RepID=UPI0020060A41|nr:HNH endonuclease family protein [Marinobacter bryozoorum]MCK7545021.1 HNH endonuclease family protein [Marinobacter bryozoorum]
MVSVRCRSLVAVFLLGLIPALEAVATIKQSSSGLCHPPHSPWYERTSNYTPYPDIDACLAAGGRLPDGIGRSGTEPVNQGYQRSQFGHGWDDRDGDCQDSRAEALISTSTTQVRFADKRRCRVVTGRWISPFTGNVLQNAGDVDIDHVVPLAWAWERGASAWSRDRRETFANDPVNLMPVEASLNRSKGARGPDQWVPPAGRCQYVARFLRIVKVYRLEPSSREMNNLRRQVEQCGIRASR